VFKDVSEPPLIDQRLAQLQIELAVAVERNFVRPSGVFHVVTNSVSHPSVDQQAKGANAVSKTLPPRRLAERVRRREPARRLEPPSTGAQ
jgi:hypothetical protein